VRLSTLAAAVLVVALLAGCGADAPEYFPLPEHGWWRYAVTERTTELVRRGKRIVVALEPVRQRGERLARRRINTAHVYYYRRTAQAVERVATQRAGEREPRFAASPEFVLPRTPAPGMRWRQQSATAVLETTVDPFRRKYRLEEPVELEYVVESVDDEVVVPGGRFRNCLRVRGTGRGAFKGDKTLFPSDIEVVHTDWYAPGIGLVRTHRVETTTSKVLPRGEYTLELERHEP